MTAELIPVIEADLRQQEVSAALDSVTPFAPGMPFYRTSALDIPTLEILTKAHLQGYFDGEWQLEETCTFFGGYVLRIDGQNALFPQCCGELGDIIYWKHLACYGRAAYHNGHPRPNVVFTNREAIFDCRDDFEEFRPATLAEIRVNRTALVGAYEQAVQELAVLARHIELVQQTLQLPVESLSELLIYRNAELPDEFVA